MRDEEFEKVKNSYLLKGIADIQERIETQTHRLLVLGDQENAIKQNEQFEHIKEKMFQCNAELLTAIAEYQEKMKKLYFEFDQ